MKYQVTCLHNNDYCKLKPGDKECHYNVFILAKSKEEARMLIHEQQIQQYSARMYNNLPMIWEVK